MPNTKLTREKLKNHFHYSRMIYAIVIIAAAMIGNLVFTVTEYRAPNANRVDIELVGIYSDTSGENCDVLEARLLEAGQNAERAADEAAGIDVGAADYRPALEVVQFLSLEYDDTSNDSDNYYALQKYMVTLAAQEGDIYFVSRNLMLQLIEDNTLVPLDGYIESGVIDPGDRELGKVTFDAYDDDGVATGERHIYGLQAGSLTKMYDELSYNPTDKYMVIMLFSQNQDTAAAVMNELINVFEPTQEELDAAEAAGQSEGN